MLTSRRFLAALLPFLALAGSPAFADITYTDHTGAKDNNTIGPGDFDSGTTTAPAAYIAADGGNVAKAYGSDAHGGTVFASAESQVNGTAAGNSLITYRVMLSGPTTTTFVPIDVIASGYALATGTARTATLDASNSNSYAGFVVTCSYCSGLLSAYAESTYGGFVQPTLSFDENIGLRTGDFMDVSMQVISASGGGNVNAGYAEAFIDPLFIIDPAFAAEGYSLVGIPTPAVSGVPEPTGAALMLAGLALAGALARRGRGIDRG